jgi:hypothetical protein
MRLGVAPSQRYHFEATRRHPSVFMASSADFNILAPAYNVMVL